MANIVNKPSDTKLGLTQGKLKSQTSSFQSRINASRQQSETIDPNTMPNRVCLMLDCSGSMAEREGAKERIELLKDAVQNFVSKCTFNNTSVAIATFPGRSDKALPLSTQSSLIIAYTAGLEAAGGTPLQACMTRSITEVSMTRGVIVSDGGATDWDREGLGSDYSAQDDTEQRRIATSILSIYKDQSIPVDCVHISQGTSGEELLRKIASETGGIFLKFSDVNAFSKAFGYLAPSYRAMLSDGSVTASQLGAKEIK